MFEDHKNKRNNPEEGQKTGGQAVTGSSDDESGKEIDLTKESFSPDLRRLADNEQLIARQQERSAAGQAGNAPGQSSVESSEQLVEKLKARLVASQAGDAPGQPANSSPEVSDAPTPQVPSHEALSANKPPTPSL